jgi:hypothetical protein
MVCIHETRPRAAQKPFDSEILRRSFQSIRSDDAEIERHKILQKRNARRNHDRKVQR